MHINLLISLYDEKQQSARELVRRGRVQDARDHAFILVYDNNKIYIYKHFEKTEVAYAFF